MQRVTKTTTTTVAIRKFIQWDRDRRLGTVAISLSAEIRGRQRGLNVECGEGWDSQS